MTTELDNRVAGTDSPRLDEGRSPGVPAPGARSAGAAPPPRRPMRERVAELMRGAASGVHASELRDAQREVMLNRTVTLIWISVFFMPFAIWIYVFLTAPPRLDAAISITLVAIGAVLLLRLLVKRGLFNRRYQLAMVLLVGCVFGPTAAAIVELARPFGGDFFFSYFLIYLAFTMMFPADLPWILLTSAFLLVSYGVGHGIGSAGLRLDQTFTTNLVYLVDLTVLGGILNRVLCKLFFDERRARIELRSARDALFAEMEVAQDIQTLLLPEEPTLSGHVIAGRMVPAAEVGGDYYDVVITEKGRSFLAIGDVSGHGVTTGLTMMMVRASLLATLEADPDAHLADIYCALNRCLRRSLERMDLRLYMTFALFEHRGAGRFTAVGGHLPAIIWRRQRREVETVEMAGVWLGVLDTIAPALIPETEIELAHDDVMVLCTDGAIERQQGSELYGFERLKDRIAASAPRGPAYVVEEVLADLERFSTVQDDDVTLLAVQRIGEGAPARVS